MTQTDVHHTPAGDGGSIPRVLNAGAKLIEGFLDEAETLAYLRAVKRRRWTNWLDRSVQQYGGSLRYDPKKNGTWIERQPAMPAWATDIAARIADITRTTRANECTVNRYKPGQRLAMHVDDSTFGPTIAMLTLAGGWPMRFRPLTTRAPYENGGLKTDDRLVLANGSLLRLERDARYRWLHGIDRDDRARQPNTRVSATFRQLPELRSNGLDGHPRPAKPKEGG